jgi:hypothetical protein
MRLPTDNRYKCIRHQRYKRNGACPAYRALGIYNLWSLIFNLPYDSARQLETRYLTQGEIITIPDCAIIYYEREMVALENSASAIE